MQLLDNYLAALSTGDRIIRSFVHPSVSQSVRPVLQVLSNECEATKSLYFSANIPH